jgi:hypothetical protein
MSAIKVIDFAVIQGHRNQTAQDRLYHTGKSTLLWPNSNHNFSPSQAFDFCPWPVDWSDREQFTYVAGIIVGVGAAMGVPLRWGGDWNLDGRLSNNAFDDLGHIELSL